MSEVNFDLNNFTLEMFKELCKKNPELQKTIEKEVEKEKEKSRKIKENIQDQLKLDIQTRLKRTIPFFSENKTIFEDLEDPEKSTKLVGGLVQSGKSNVICGLAVYLNLVFKLDIVVVVRDIIADSKQLYQKFIRDFKDYFDKPLRVRSIKDIKHEQDIFIDNIPSIIICIEHQKHLEKIRKNVLKRKYVLIADEADAVCYKDPSQKNPIRNPIFNMIKDHSSQFIGITATAYDMLYLESELYSDSIYHVPIHSCYKGIDHPDFKMVELNSSFDFSLRETVDPLVWKFSKDMQRFYSRICNQPVFEEKTEDGVLIHPVFCLQTTETDKDRQFQYLGAFARHPLFKTQITAIVYNSEGVFCYSPDGVDRHIIIQNSEIDGEEKIHKSTKPTSPYLANCEVVQFKKLGLGEILQYFKDRRDPPTHIVVIAGLMVGRGLNVVSSDFKWHITHQILRNSDNATCADIVQKLRVLGIYRDSIPIRLFCLQRDAITIKQSSKLQARIFEGADLQEEVETMPDLCEEIKIYVGNIPQRRTTKKCKEPHWNKVAHEREQYEEVKEKFEEVGDTDEEWGLKHMINNIKTRLREGRETVIIRLLKFLLKQNTPLSGSFIQEMCGISALCNFTRWNKEHSSYQVLIKSGDKWKINPLVIQALKNSNLYEFIIQ